MPRPQSSIWQYFTIVDAPDGKGRKAKCNYCNHQQACGVTRLHQHLIRKCTKIPETLHEDLLQKEAARGKSLTLQATQRSAMTQEVLQLLQQRQQQQAQQQNTHEQQQASSSSSSYQTIEIDRALSTIASNSLATANSAALRAAAAVTTIQQQQSSSTTSSSLSSGNNNNMNNRYENLSSPSSPSPHSYSNPHHHHYHHHPTSNSHHSSSNSNGTTDTPGNLASSDPMSQRMLDYNLARALFSANIPFNVVDNQEFATFLKRMRPGYAVPKSHVLQQYLLKEEHYDLIPQEPQNQQNSLAQSFDSGISNGMGPRSPSSSNSAPSTSSGATISRIIHAHTVSGGNSNVNSNTGSSNNTGSGHQANDIVSSSSTHHHSNHNSRVMHRPTGMDGSL
ncbi:hypothetical protein BDA99DRAFT_501166 [Phascolomyces articulosus]|uniref:BED-type domain-containing protein n=1 Tax=Phascolomyces articulosus TaxID=60185 RepID=A0AAD5KIJ1_9FUNG|nr:hypothetical protein BDA99DRAFT_501166 [Phascolomyces articulosus]